MKKMLGWILKAALLAFAVMTLSVMMQTFAFALGEGGMWATSSVESDHSLWPTVQGSVSYYGGEDDEGYVDVSFEYEVGGVSYRGMQMWHGENRKYSRGETVTVYYDPGKPSISVVDPSRSQLPGETVLVGLGVVIATFVAYVVIVVWAWNSNVTRSLPGGPKAATFSWWPNHAGGWRTAGVALGLASAALVFPLSPLKSSAAVGFYLPVALFLLTAMGFASAVKIRNNRMRKASGSGSYMDVHFGAHMCHRASKCRQ
jgi:hypothetical protein